MSKDSNCVLGGDPLRYEPRGAICAAFAAGMIVAALFPCKTAVLIIALILILAGLSLCRY